MEEQFITYLREIIDYIWETALIKPRVRLVIRYLHPVYAGCSIRVQCVFMYFLSPIS